MPDPHDIDTAIVTKLGADATLLSYVPNGIYWDMAPSDSTRFITVSLVAPQEVWVFGGVGYVRGIYKVLARAQAPGSNPTLSASAATAVKSAASRINALLHQGTLGTVSGYTFMAMYRDDENEPWIHITERDDLDTSIRWYHRGGHFVVEMSRT